MTLFPVDQQPHTQEVIQGIQGLLKQLLEHNILTRCEASWNPPLLLLHKPRSSEYTPVQDLGAVSHTTDTIHTIVPNLYTLQSLLYQVLPCLLA